MRVQCAHASDSWRCASHGAAPFRGSAQRGAETPWDLQDSIYHTDSLADVDLGAGVHVLCYGVEHRDPGRRRACSLGFATRASFPKRQVSGHGQAQGPLTQVGEAIPASTRPMADCIVAGSNFSTVRAAPRFPWRSSNCQLRCQKRARQGIGFRVRRLGSW